MEGSHHHVYSPGVRPDATHLRGARDGTHHRLVELKVTTPIAVGDEATGALGSIVFSVALVAVFLQYSKNAAAAASGADDAEACLVAEEDPDMSLCGRLSFDSTDDYVCIETEDGEGNLRWACQ